MFGYGGVVGTAAADDGTARGSHPTPEEFAQSLRELDHIGIRRQYDGRLNRDAISSVSELDTSVTPGRGHPDVYFGEFKNAQTPSGDYFSVSDNAFEADSNTVPVSVNEDDVSSDFVSFGQKIGCATLDLGWITERLCVSIQVGVNLEFLGDDKIGGKLYADFVFKHPSSGAQVTVSPAGFGIYADLDNPLGICLSPTFRAPGPIPGKIDSEICFDYTFTVQGDDLKMGFEFSKLEVCVEDDTFCVDILTFSFGFQFKVADVSDVPFLTRGGVSPETPPGLDT
ncbi:hypothetical protein [Halobaculum sp. MBLA0143]|uniref:hypothetical protein n=1 Tax=Halobaculum sp. MBLA0143 TaxID=3079933 RepID=UPI0035258A3A